MEQSRWEDLVRIAKLVGGKLIIVEGGQPRCVIMDFDTFEDLAVPKYTAKLTRQAEAFNEEITRAKLMEADGNGNELMDEVVVGTEQTNVYPEGIEDITIEPLDRV